MLKNKTKPEYAHGAIACLSAQLANAKTEARRVKLQGRIDAWKKKINP